jgi:predicted phosphodiesterase
MNPKPTNSSSLPTDRLRRDRRDFLRTGSALLASGLIAPGSIFGVEKREPLRFGLMTDLHYADKQPAGTRHYRESLDKIAEAAERFEAAKPAFIVELGDLIDAAPEVDVELGYLKRINREFSAIGKDRHYVLGNHCVDTLKKEEFLGEVEREKSYYSFDRGGFHFVILDSCFRGDGEPYGRRNFHWTDPNIPAAELEWLAADLGKNEKPVIVFAHQRLDVGDNHAVKNAPKVREILEKSGRVRAVFQGHSHKNDLREINGIRYCTLVAMVEGSGAEQSGYALIDIDAAGAIRLSGFRKQKAYRWE